MTITASARKTLPTRADLLAATAAIAQITASSPQPDQSSLINKAALHYIYLLIPSGSRKQPISTTRRHCNRGAPRSKSP